MTNLATPLQEPVFSIDYRVIYGDTDAGGVVYNANYLRYFEIARTELMRRWALPYSEIEQRGFILPVTESYLRFKAPALYDDLVTIAVSLVELKKVSCRFNYRITKPGAAEGDRVRLLVKGFTCHACVNRQGRLTPFPTDILDIINSIFKKVES